MDRPGPAKTGQDRPGPALVSLSPRMWGKKIPRADNGSFSKYHQLFLAPNQDPTFSELSAAADEEAMLIHQLEMPEIQEEIDNEDDDEDLEILEEEEANVTPKAPENNKEKKFQPQITSFFAKKK